MFQNNHQGVVLYCYKIIKLHGVLLVWFEAFICRMSFVFYLINIYSTLKVVADIQSCNVVVLEMSYYKFSLNVFKDGGGLFP